MKEDLVERIRLVASHIYQTHDTIRKTASIYGYSKSTIHHDVSIKLKSIDYNLYLKVKGILEKNGLLAFTTFTPENFCEIRRITGLSLDYKSKADITAALEKDYQILHIEEYRKVLNFNNPLELLAHMKNTGVNSLAAKGLTFKEVKDFCDKYLELYPDVRLTYAPIIVIAGLK